MLAPMQLTSAVSPDSASVLHTESFHEALAMVRAGLPVDLLPGRQLRPDELSTRMQELQLEHTAMRAHLLNRIRGTSPEERILHLLRAGSQQVNTTGFDDPITTSRLQEIIRQTLYAKAALPMVLLLGGDKAPNPLKTAHYFRPDVAELLSLLRLGALAWAVREVHPYGAVIVAIPDAMLHTSDIGTAAASAFIHQRELREWILRLGLEGLVHIPDPIALLPDTWSDEVLWRAGQAQQLARVEAAAAEKARRQAWSLRMSLNTRVFGLSMRDNVQLFAHAVGQDAGDNSALRRFNLELTHRAEDVIWHYIGVNHAIRTLDLAGRAAEVLTGSRLHLRLSVHAKPGEPRPSLGPVRSNRHIRPGLLPMHGLGYREVGSDGRIRWGMKFAIEAAVGRLRPVVDERGSLLHLEPTIGPG